MPTIIIPSNDESCLRACVAAIRENEPFIVREEILAVFDGIEPYSLLYENIFGVQPFCFARNVNRGIKAVDSEDGGVILLNHDALLETPGGFSSLIASCTPEYGLVSAAVCGACCNKAQDWITGPEPRDGLMVDTDLTVAFVAVYIPRRTLDAIGLLDERLTGYGRDDDLYCLQVRKAGLKIGVWHGCVVEHQSLPSSYRTRPDCGELADYNLRVFGEIVEEQGLGGFLSDTQRAAIARGHNV